MFVIIIYRIINTTVLQILKSCKEIQRRKRGGCCRRRGHDHNHIHSSKSSEESGTKTQKMEGQDAKEETAKKKVSRMRRHDHGSSDDKLDEVGVTVKI